MKTAFPWPPVASAGAAAAWLFVIGVDEGGLAQLAFALLAALVVGLPAARLFQKHGKTTALTQASRVLQMVVAVSVLGGVLAMSGLPVAYRVGLAGALWVVSRVLPIPAASFCGLLAMLVTLVAGLSGIGAWTLLEPVWSTTPQWWSVSAVVGLLLVGGGGVAWRSDTSGRHPSIALGAGLLVALSMALLLALDWELGSSLPAVTALFLSGGAVLGTAGDGPSRQLALPGVVLAMLAALAPVDAAIILVHTFVPLGTAGLLVWIARSTTGMDRWLACALVVALVVIAMWAWPGMPESVAASMTVALVPVFAVWLLGPRWLASQAEPRRAV